MLFLAAIGASDLRQAALYVFCLIAAVAVHEFAHAFAAHRLGDPTPEAEGRLTLNPLAHIDLVGTVLLPILLAVSSSNMLFGWGKPVQTQPRFYTRRMTMRGGMALVAFAGPLSNLVMAILTLGVVFGLAQTSAIHNPDVVDFVRLFFTLNVLLFVFNLLPIHPLDGGKVLGWLLGARYEGVDQFLQQWGFMILLGLVFAARPVLDVVFGPFFYVAGIAFHAVSGV